MEDCIKWDNVPEGTDVRDMIPWVNPEASILIGIEEDEFNQAAPSCGQRRVPWQYVHVPTAPRLRFSGSRIIVLDIVGQWGRYFLDDRVRRECIASCGSRRGEEIVRLALDRGISIDSKVANGKGLSALLFAARMGHAGIVALLLEKGSCVDVTDNDRNSALSHAASRGHEAVVRVLLENGAKVSLKNSEGWTALHHASSNGYAGVVERLISHGAEIDATDSDGLSSLFRAAICGHASTVRFLLQKGADPNLKSLDQEWTPLLAAVCMEQEDVVQVLVEVSNGVIDLEARAGSSGKTALMIAVERQFERIVGILISKGADIFAPDISEQSPVSHSRRNSYPSQRISRGYSSSRKAEEGRAAARESGGRSGTATRTWTVGTDFPTPSLMTMGEGRNLLAIPIVPAYLVSFTQHSEWKCSSHIFPSSDPLGTLSATQIHHTNLKAQRHRIVRT